MALTGIGHPIYNSQHLSNSDGLIEVADSSQRSGFPGGFERCGTRNQDHRRMIRVLYDLAKDVDSVSIGELAIQQHRSDLRPPEDGERLVACDGDLVRPPVSSQRCHHE